MSTLLTSLVLALAPLGGDELSDLKVKLRASSKWVRQSAVESLAKLGTQEAFELVIGALSDPMGEVAESAQWVLGGVTDEETIKLLLGKEGAEARKPLVRRRAVEVLGRLTVELDADDLRDLLGDKDPGVRRALAVSLARAAAGITGDRDRLVAALEKGMNKDRDGRARGEGLLALAALDPVRARAWWDEEATDDPAPAVVCAAARGAEALNLTVAELNDLALAGERAVRAEVVEALARSGTRAAARGLVACLAAEQEQRLQRRIAALLRGLSGLKFRVDPRPWRDWVAGLPDDWTPAEPSEDAEEDEEADVSSTLAGLPILSGRVAFVVDLSGSMWKKRADGKTRKEVVDEQIRACIEALPQTTRFNVITFTRDAMAWEDEVAPATLRNKEAAARWFEARKETGTGNFWDAFLLALYDPEVDTVVMLGDGEPTGSEHYRLELLADFVYHEILGRSVVVDSILIDAKAKKTRAAWGEIAARTGGMSIRVDL